VILWDTRALFRAYAGREVGHDRPTSLLTGELGRELRFVTSDVDQAAAARSEKLRVILVN